MRRFDVGDGPVSSRHRGPCFKHAGAGYDFERVVGAGPRARPWRDR